MSGGSLSDAALDAAGRGWCVFPLVAGRKTPRRVLTDWETKATADPDRVRRWWARHPADNIGIATGPSGLVVVDLDQAKPGETPPARWPRARGGADVLAELAHQHGQDLPPTWTVATPSGGRHLYYRAPDGAELRNTAGRIGWRIDTRAHGGYVVAAGSVVDRQPYRVVDPAPPVELPAWLAELTTPPTPATPAAGSVRPVPAKRGYVQAVLAGEVETVLAAPVGARNETLNRAAWNLGRLVAQGLMPRPVVETALQTAGEALGLTPTEVAATVRSGLNARLNRR